MVKMEGNKDEALRCLSLANKCFAEGNLEKAIKFAAKSNRLYPSSRATGIIGYLISICGSLV